MANKNEYNEGYYHGAGSTQEQARGARDAENERRKKDQDFWNQYNGAFQRQQNQGLRQRLEREQQEKQRREYEKQQQQEQERHREKQRLANLKKQEVKEANKRTAIQKQQKKSTFRKTSVSPKSNNPSKRKWSWKAAIISFFIVTVVGIVRFELAKESALILGGISGIVFGFYYKPISVLAIIGFIIYAVAKNQ